MYELYMYRSELCMLSNVGGLHRGGDNRYVFLMISEFLKVKELRAVRMWGREGIADKQNCLR
jgi:hypothetical protein